jgi:ADP-ribose pyrophosphatase YjhB (NUDIX family)
VLLIRRGRAPRLGHWSIPGGRQQAGETIHEAIIREIREETAIEITILDIAAVVDLIDRQDDKIAYHYTVIDMLAQWRSGEVRAGDDALDADWFNLDEIAGLGLPDLQLKVIRDSAAKMRELAA